MNRTAVCDVVEKINWDVLDREDANVDSADDFLAIAGAAAAGVAAAGAVAVGGAAVGAAVGGICFAGAFALVISRNFADASKPEFIEGVKRDLSAATGERASRFNFVTKEPGSVIMYFNITEDLSADSSSAEAVHRAVLAQVDDKSSRLYQGAITCDIDAARTKATTATVSRSTTNTAGGMEVDAVSALWSSTKVSPTTPGSLAQSKDALRSVLDAAFAMDHATLPKSEQETILGNLFDSELKVHQAMIGELLAESNRKLTAILSASIHPSEIEASTESCHLAEFAVRVKGDLLPLTPAETEALVWEGSVPFDKSPWERYDSVRLYRSKSLDAYVTEALQHVVRGEGMDMTQRELIDEIREGCPGILVWIFGGFIRDAVQGNTGSDMDLKFITDRTGMKKMVEFGQAKGWTCKAHTRSQEKTGSEPKYNYVRFGEIEKRDVEGKCAENSYTKLVGWGAAEFACNDLLYSIEHKVVIDLTGVGKEDAEQQLLRIPVWPFLAEGKEQGEEWQLKQWQQTEGAGGIYRWLKFRDRKYKPADDKTRVFMVKHIAGYLHSREASWS
jgi:hypothetical protein